jgi:hypothetical protein
LQSFEEVLDEADDDDGDEDEDGDARSKVSKRSAVSRKTKGGQDVWLKDDDEEVRAFACWAASMVMPLTVVVVLCCLPTVCRERPCWTFSTRRCLPASAPRTRTPRAALG